MLGVLCPFSQLTTLISSQPIIFDRLDLAKPEVEPAKSLHHGLDEHLRFHGISLIRLERYGCHAHRFQPLHNLVSFRCQ